MSTSTTNALMARGFDSSLATILSAKYTITELKKLQDFELINLGLSQEQVRQIHGEARPPIPTDTLIRVLYKNRRTCCICRDPRKSVILHHITEWSKSRSHDDSNLSVLCLDHHDAAHTKKSLTLNLTEKEIRESKMRWEEDVLRLDARTIVRMKNQSRYSRWDWINLPRLFELVLRHGINLKRDGFFIYLLEAGFIDENGVLTPERQWPNQKEKKYWFLDFDDGFRVAYYLSALVDSVLESLPIIDITEHITKKSVLRSLIAEGEYIAAQLPFYFKNLDNKEDKVRELKRAYYRGHGVVIEYVFDAWHCMSNSARHSGMTGHKVQTVFGPVRSIIDDAGELVISISCLASGTAFAQHVARGGEPLEDSDEQFQ